VTIVITLGWAIVHSLWQCTLISGLAAMTLSLFRERHARQRYRIACVSLGLMAILPAATAIARANVLDAQTRNQVVAVIEQTIGLPAVVSWRAVVVPAAAVVWIAGLSFCLLRVVTEVRRARGLRRDGLVIPAEDVRATVADLRARVRVPDAVDVFESARAGVPMVLGWRRPIILLPARSAGRLSAEQLRAVLAHELAHVRRRDYVTNLVQIAADALLFHHPAARWLSRRIRIEREYCCDDEAVAIGRDPTLYARALAALEESRAEGRLAVAAASGTLLDRIQRIAGAPRPTLTPLRGSIALVVSTIIAAVILGFAAAVPPSLPLDVKLRMRSPAPNGVVPQGPEPQSLPRKRPAPGR
jgi:beta-lactamase regulating signal transducer with metallopeptidase domain